MRMNAVLSNPKHPEYGQFTVPLPIPHNQYDGIMEALNAMDMGDPLARDCQMDEILGEYPILKRLEGKPVNIDELDYLAKRLDSFCYAQEGAQFQGAAVSYDYSDMTDLINLTFSCQQVTVITDFSDLEQVGRDHYMVLNGGCASKEELDALDGYETALLLIDEGNGVITPYGVVQKVAEVNARRRQAAPGRQLTGSSWNDPEVQRDSSLALDYIVAPPRMAHYIDWSTKIYGVYLKYLAPEDIFPYSIDEVFMDVTNYLDTYKMTDRELAQTIILDILKTTGITAAAGMGPNLYLAKIAMDIVAKHVQPDKDGVRIAKLNEMTYRKLLWSHRPLTDFWRVGRGYATKLEANGLYTMGDIARCSIGKPTDYHNEELLYRLFGVNAELLIDHAWGWEPCTIADVKAYKPENKSIVSGQVLQCPYPFDKARLVVREMADSLALDLVDKGLVTNQLVLTVGYDIENLAPTRGGAAYAGETTTDRYGRKIPKHAVGTENFSYTSSANDLLETITALYDRIVDKALLVRRLSISANRLLHEEKVPKQDEVEQLDLFTDYAAKEKQKAENAAEHARERKIQKTILGIKKKFGKNAILKGLNLEDGATARERNQTIGGHQA